MTIFRSIQDNDLKSIKSQILSKKYDNEMSGLEITPFLYALNFHKYGIADYILRINSTYINDKDSLNNTALHYLVKIGFSLPNELCGDKDILKLVNAHFINDTSINTIKHKLYEPSFKYINKMIGDVLVDEVNIFGSTALHFACYYWYEPLIVLLLNKGFSNEIKNNSGLLPSDYIQLEKNLIKFNRLQSYAISDILLRDIPLLVKNKSVNKI